MREIKRFVLGLMAAALLFTPVDVHAAASNIYIADDADILSDEDESEVLEYLETLNSNTKYVVATTSESSMDTTDEKLFDYYTSQYSNYDDGVAFIIDMDERVIWMSGYGKYQRSISSADATDITDNIYRYASKGDYKTCILKAFNQADTLTNKGFILRPMRIIVAFLLAIIIGFLFSFFMAMSERSKVKMDSKGSEILLAGAAIAGTAAIYDTRRVRRSQNSSSGGHSGGGFSGGGGGYSGGGGHSGGGHSF
ncbi:uncharacterized protein SAMN05421493_11660 [Pseudobutyrivibrio sp. 49]|uniref:TPM domain-containing protein n=1 Tax=unclassified Pseudobutyrivibrio TaxID=2638619 RepID=UPI00087F639E|nr:MULTISPECIES: TPM domain-containing protein [unclassified Pseudobutyrivibrio]SDI50672.1 uncharacterized protein SAMN05421493_11660 [Pseudobutyrivibrio sp. 49]SFO23615.1 uncharacterized protein SAMN04487831_11359 [Pseudobutyrivibrio sp. UC1225]